MALLVTYGWVCRRQAHLGKRQNLFPKMFNRTIWWWWWWWWRLQKFNFCLLKCWVNSLIVIYRNSANMRHKFDNGTVLKTLRAIIIIIIVIVIVIIRNAQFTGTAHPVAYPVKRPACEVDRLHTSNVQVQNNWSYASVPTFAFVACTGAICTYRPHCIML